MYFLFKFIDLYRKRNNYDNSWLIRSLFVSVSVMIIKKNVTWNIRLPQLTIYSFGKLKNYEPEYTHDTIQAATCITNKFTSNHSSQCPKILSFFTRALFGFLNIKVRIPCKTFLCYIVYFFSQSAFGAYICSRAKSLSALMNLHLSHNANLLIINNTWQVLPIWFLGF